MSKIKKLVASPAITIGALVLAVALLAFSAIGGTRAALTYYSDNYVSTMQLHELGVSLLENGHVVATGDAGSSIEARSKDSVTKESALLAPENLILAAAGETGFTGEPFRLGAVYQEQLAVRNSTNAEDEAANYGSNITQYVRVTVQRYWLKPVTDAAGKQKTDEEGNPLWTKDADLDPDLIKLVFATGNNGWEIDDKATTDERTVLYYTRPLAPGAATPHFTETLQIDPSVQVIVKREIKGNIITNTYVYDNCSFQLEVKVDAVQDHNVEDAILSAWGREVTTSEVMIDGKLTRILSLS